MAEKSAESDDKAQQLSSEALRNIEGIPKTDAAVLKEALLLIEKSEKKKQKQEARVEWIKKAVESALAEATEAKHSYIEVSDGKSSQKEGIPVDALLESLIEGVDADALADVYQGGDLRAVIRDIVPGLVKVADLDRTNVDEGEAQLVDSIDFIIKHNAGACSQDDIQRLELARQLLVGSERFSDIDRGEASDSEPDWRVKLEEEFLRDEGDYRHGEVQGDDYRSLAEQYLNRRREVFVNVDGQEATQFEPVTPGEEMVPYMEGEAGMVPKREGEEHIVPYIPGEEHIVPYQEGEEHMVPYREEPDDIVPADQGEEPNPAPEKKERIILADASEIAKAMAWRIAENRLNEIVHYDNGPTPPRFWGRLWRGVRGVVTQEFWRAQFAKMGEQGYLTKFYREALEEIENNQDLMTDIRGRLLGESEVTTASTPDKAEHYRLLDAVVREVENEVIEAEERGEDLIGRGEIFSDLINRHMAGEFADRNAFEEAAREAIQRAIASGQIDQSDFSSAGREGDAEGLMYASNLWDIAERYRAQALEQIGALSDTELSAEQQEALQGIISGIGQLDIRLATKFQDLNEARARRPDGRGGYLSIWERSASWARSRPILGAIANPTVIGFFSGFATRTALRHSALFGAGVAIAGSTAFGTFGLSLLVGAGVAGTIAYIRRKRNLAFDRGMEQRRETIGQQGQGRRAEQIREFGFSDIAGEAETLTAEIRAGDTLALLRASALLEAERQLRNAGRPVDLIWSSTDEGERSRSNLVPKTDLKIAVRENAPADDPEWNGRVMNMAADYIERVNMNDDRFERFRKREGVKAAATTALAAGVLGAIGQEVVHGIQWHVNPEEAAQRITLLDYVAGHRPSIEYAQIGNTSYPAEMIQTAPDGSRFINVNTSDVTEGRVVGGYFHMPIGPDGTIHPDMAESHIPEGYTYDAQTGELSHVVAHGVEGGALTPESWDHFREYVVDRYPELFDKTHVSWAKFYENGHPPFGNSYEPGYIANSEGTELQMDFHHGAGGYSVSFERMAGHIAYGSGGEFRIHPNTPILVTIGPRDFATSHEVFTAVVTPEHGLQFPHEVGDQIMTMDHGQPVLKEGWMITGNRLFGEVNGAGHEGGETIAGHVVAEYNPGQATLTGTADEVETVRVLGGEYHPPIGTPEGPLPIPIDFRRPIGNVVPGERQTGQQEETQPQEQPEAEQRGETNDQGNQTHSEDDTSQSDETQATGQESPQSEAIQSPAQGSENILRRENAPEVTERQRRREQFRALTAQAENIREVVRLPFEQRRGALVGLRQELIENDIITPEQAFFTIDGQSISYDQLSPDQDLIVVQQLSTMADDLERRAIAAGGRSGRSRQSAAEREELAEAA